MQGRIKKTKFKDLDLEETKGALHNPVGDAVEEIFSSLPCSKRRKLTDGPIEEVPDIEVKPSALNLTSYFKKVEIVPPVQSIFSKIRA
jgi:hypothetical protein